MPLTDFLWARRQYQLADDPLGSKSPYLSRIDTLGSNVSDKCEWIDPSCLDNNYPHIARYSAKGICLANECLT